MSSKQQAATSGVPKCHGLFYFSRSAAKPLAVISFVAWLPLLSAERTVTSVIGSRSSRIDLLIHSSHSSIGRTHSPWVALSPDVETHGEDSRLLALSERRSSNATFAHRNWASREEQPVHTSRRLMSYQTIAKYILTRLLAMVYIAVIIYRLCSTYSRVKDTSSITFFSPDLLRSGDDMAIEGHNRNCFLATFNKPPSETKLQVSGYSRTSCGRRSQLRLEFSFSLDLTPWVEREESHRDLRDGHCPAEDGVSDEDLVKLDHFLARECVPLSAVVIEKLVHWPDWEELATNIKAKVRQAGFEGHVFVHYRGNSILNVQRNDDMANFMRHEKTKALVSLSVIFWIPYAIYMYVCSPTIKVQAKYRINVPLADYWRLIEERLGVREGFIADSRVPISWP